MGLGRSQKKLARGRTASRASDTGSGIGVPPGVTQKDGAVNIAGDVTRFSTDDYQPAARPSRAK